MTNELIDTQVLRLINKNKKINLSLEPNFETAWMGQDALMDFFDISKKELIKGLSAALKKVDKAQHVRRVHFIRQHDGVGKAGYESQYSLNVVLRLALCLDACEVAEQIKEWMLQSNERLLSKGFVLDKARIQGEERRLALFEKQSQKIKT